MNNTEDPDPVRKGYWVLGYVYKKMQNELYRLTFCGGNVLKIALGTQPRRPQLGSEGFPGRLLD